MKFFQQKLENFLKNIQQANKIKFNPTDLNDEIAVKTEWTPCKGGGSNFGTHKLKLISHNRAEFKVATGALLFSFVFILMGLSSCFIPFIMHFTEQGTEAPFSLTFMITPSLVGILFAGAGSFLFRKFKTPIVFDLSLGYYWKSYTKPNYDTIRNIKEHCFIKEIYAIQLLQERCTGDKSSYYSYEINLVLKDASRINVIDHGNKKLIEQDAQELAIFLKKPLWKAI